jgi:peptide/nickel transport system substrate-binding protein
MVIRSLVVILVAAAVGAAPAAGGSAQAPERGGTLSFGPVNEPACLNPLVERCTAGSLTLIFALEKVLEPAFDVSPRFTFRPRLVSRVTVSSEPPYTLTYRIRRAARWSDGVPVTAQDFVFTHRARLAQQAALDEPARVALRRVRSVTAVDAKTVRVVLRSPFAGWRSLFGNVLPAHVLRGTDLSKVWTDRIENPKTGRPIGSGPFLVERWERGRQLTLVRNPRYREPHPAYLGRIVIRFRVSGDDPVEWLRSGELDIAYEVFPGAVPALRRASGVRVLSEPGSGYEHLAMRVGSGGHPALRNPLVRRALAHAIDRRALVAGVLGAIDPTARPLESVVFIAQSPYYRPKWARYRYRPATVRRLLAQAGCRRGADEIYSCSGRRLSLRFTTTTGVPPRERLLSLIQAQLRRVGIEAVPTYAPPPAFLGTILPRGDFDVALFGWVNDPSASGGDLIFSCGGRQNYTGHCDRSVTRDLDRAERALSAREQARVLNRADDRIARDVPVIPLFQIPRVSAVKTNVRNFVLSFNPLADSANWWLER